MFKSNAVRSCVELHEIELRRFYDTWQAFRASGVALPRTVATLLENHQTADGGVRIPKALRPWLGGLEELTPGGA